MYANVVGTTMSSTGFVTFLDLTSVATAASTPLTHKPNVLRATVAPEPRDIRWRSAPVLEKTVTRRENFVNILLTFGIVLWSIPLTAIQAFATAEQVARLPGMDWVLTFDAGHFTSFINGYLPVIALLSLIMLLPIIFEQIAVRYEHRKTVSDVQRSMLGRYFYYQLANIYLTVTAGSFWESVADILDHPGNILEILGRSLPKVVGYFISLLITKILAGLPIIVLRVGALSRMLLLRGLFSQDKVTQREMDFVYRKENLLYGWEYPSQLLVIVICFTYACKSFATTLYEIESPTNSLLFFQVFVRSSCPSAPSTLWDRSWFTRSKHYTSTYLFMSLEEPCSQTPVATCSLVYFAVKQP
jgi:hypothetical protein